MGVNRSPIERLITLYLRIFSPGNIKKHPKFTQEKVVLIWATFPKSKVNLVIQQSIERPEEPLDHQISQLTNQPHPKHQ